MIGRLVGRLIKPSQLQCRGPGDQKPNFCNLFLRVSAAILPSFVPMLFTNEFCWVRLKIITLVFFLSMCRVRRVFAAGNARMLFSRIKIYLLIFRLNLLTYQHRVAYATCFFLYFYKKPVNSRPVNSLLLTQMSLLINWFYHL